MDSILLSPSESSLKYNPTTALINSRGGMMKEILICEVIYGK
jgi:hypothetical protein